MKPIKLILLFTLAALCTNAQTVSIPGGTSGISNNTSNSYVGIGLAAAPVYLLDVGGTVQSKGYLRTTGVGNGYGYLADDGVGSTIFSITRQPNNEARFQSFGFHTFYSGNSTGQERMRIDASGNVGIGTSSPNYRLDVETVAPGKAAYFQTSGSWQAIDFSSDGGATKGSLSAVGGLINIGTSASGTTSFVNINLSNGNTGINVSNPTEKLHVDGSVGVGTCAGSGSSGLQVVYTDGGSGMSTFKHMRWGGDFYFTRGGSAGDRTQLYFGGSGNHRMDIYDGNNQVNVRLNTGGDSYFNGGNVGIGTASPDAKLAVSGQVHAQEVKVSVTVPGPDYVFEKDYKLTSLEEIKNYIDQNKHLPEVPSAKEMEKNGIQLGEMNMLLLKKIEELTLYVIELKKENEKHQTHIQNLETKIESIKNK